MRSPHILFLFIVFFSCSSNINQNENCRFLLNVGVNLTLDLNLPQYGELQFVGNSVYEPNQGNAGVIIARIGIDNYVAWDAADPNHVLQPCSVLVNSGLFATCGCDDKNKYNLVNGLAENSNLQCSLKLYRVEKNGNLLFISN